MKESLGKPKTTEEIKNKDIEEISAINTTAIANIKYSLTPSQKNIKPHTLSAHMPQFLLPDASYVTFNKTLQSMLKGKKTQSEETKSKHQNQTQIWQKFWNYQTRNL